MDPREFNLHISGTIGKEFVYFPYRNTIRRRIYIIPPYSRTTSQAQRRNKFKDAVSEWQNLSDEQKEAWNRKAIHSKKQMEGFNLFISKYMRT